MNTNFLSDVLMIHSKNARSVILPLCVIATFSTANVFAADTSSSFDIKEEDTQLAKRFAVREAVESPFEYSLGIAYRRDSLSWTAASGDVNIGSELHLNGTAIRQVDMAASARLRPNWYLRGRFLTGAVISGTNSDSNYAASNRTQEYSRSEAQTGGAASDASISIGRRFIMGDAKRGVFKVMPLFGVAYHTQSLMIYDGTTRVPYDAPISGLDNNYQTQWKSFWLGMDMDWKLLPELSLTAAAQYHRANYAATADWNLRTDYAHPKSFEHDAKGSGKVLSLGLSYQMRRNVSLSGMLAYQDWRTQSGSERTYLSSGTSVENTLNAVNWKSTMASFGVKYEF